MNDAIISISEWAGTIICSIFLLPQIIKLFKYKSAADLSLFSNIIGIVAASIWIFFLDFGFIGTDIMRHQIIASIADWGILFSCITLTIYQLVWNHRNKGFLKIRKEAKQMNKEELIKAIEGMKGNDQ